MDRLWTPWRYSYIAGTKPQPRKGVPEALEAWPGEDLGCVFCNLIASVRWGAEALGSEAAEKAGHVIAQFGSCYACLNAYPYNSGHLLIVPYRHVDALAKLEPAEASELMEIAQRLELALRKVYKPAGINLGMNMGEAAGAGVADHLHMHELPRWFGDTNFMSVLGETRVLPETLDTTCERIRDALK